MVRKGLTVKLEKESEEYGRLFSSLQCLLYFTYLSSVWHQASLQCRALMFASYNESCWSELERRVPTGIEVEQTSWMIRQLMWLCVKFRVEGTRVAVLVAATTKSSFPVEIANVHLRQVRALATCWPFRSAITDADTVWYVESRPTDVELECDIDNKCFSSWSIRIDMRSATGNSHHHAETACTFSRVRVQASSVDCDTC
jgi:hypothetical protein